MSEEKHIAVWNNVLHFVEQNIEPKQFSTWFKPIRPLAFDRNSLTVEVPSEFFREYLEDAFFEILKSALKKEIGADAKLVYSVRPVRKQPALVYPGAPGTTAVNKEISVNNFSSTRGPGAFVFPGIQKIRVNPQLNPTFCFKNLIEGECNRMGVTAGKSIAMAPGSTAFNPLFLFGGPGLGKTHIAQAIGNAVKESSPELVVLYVPAHRFKLQYMDAVIRNNLSDFIAFYQKMDVLIVDDIQDLASPGTQTAFFNVFNHLHQSGKQLVFTSDRAPVDLQNFEERLLSRLKWGLSVELLQPDYQTRLAMLKARNFRDGSLIPDDVLEYLASSIHSNFRELEGVLISLIAYAAHSHQPLTKELASNIIGNIVSKDTKEVSLDVVQKVVCDYFGITKDAMQSKCRKRVIVQARQIAMYMARNLIPNCSLATIGNEIGGKDHATVLHACSTVTDLMSTDRSFKQYISDIEKQISNYRR